MKKQILLLMLFALCLSTTKTSGQYTNDVSLNTRVSVLTDDVTGVTRTAITPSGKTYIAYLDGYFTLKLQLLDENGNKVFDSTGIILEETSTSWSAARSTDIIIDGEGDAIIAFWNWTNDSVKLYVVSPTGLVQDILYCGSGFNPQLEMLPTGDFVLAFSNSAGDSTTIKKLNYSPGVINTLYTRTVNYLCQDLKALPNGNFYIVSYDYTYAGYALTYANCMGGNDGNLMWPAWVACSSLSNTSLYTALVSCCIDNNKNLFITNTYFSGMNRFAYAQKIDSLGNIMWGTNGIPLINNGVFNYQQRVFTMMDISAGQLLCLINGQNVNDGSPTFKVCYQKISQNGTILIPPAGIELVPASANAQLFGAGYCGDDVALTYISGINNNIYAIKINLEGVFQWSPSALALNTTSNSKSWVDATLGAIVNEQLIISFNETRNGHSGVFAQKASCDGLLPTNILRSDDPVPIRIYPNPTAGKIMVDCTVEPNPNLFLYNMMGALMLYKELNSANNEIDISSLPKGLYVVEISCPEKAAYYKIIKE